eukprot:GHVP01029270.1.p1 GENE.GHVP01029270.1~~GHVP01029270.1.p1  ORF type:complete len:114 (-),score=5.91 GHVP01029270.1:1202-1543(-)
MSLYVDASDSGIGTQIYDQTMQSNIDLVKKKISSIPKSQVKYTANATIVRKPDFTHRITHDFSTHHHIQDNLPSYPNPLTVAYHSKIDLTKAFHYCPICASERPYYTFLHPRT